MAKRKTKHPFLSPKYIERLQQLRRVVVAVPTNLFNISIEAEKTACGTAGCAYGHAGLDPWFRRRGLKTSIIATSYGGRYGSVEPSGTYDIHAFFGADDVSSRLFDSLEELFYATPEGGTKAKTLKKIDKLLAGKYLV